MLKSGVSEGRKSEDGRRNSATKGMGRRVAGGQCGRGGGWQ